MRLLVLSLLAERSATLSLASDTLRLHELGVEQFSRTLGRPARVDDFTDRNLARHASRRLADGRSRATIAPEQSKLLALWRYACRRGYCREWPTIGPIKIPDRVPLAWMRDEIAKLFAACETMAPVGGVPGPDWWEAILSVMWDSGERITATLGIEWWGVDLERLTILVPAEVRKGQTTDRLYPIASDTAARLALLPRDRSPFHWPYCEATLYNRYEKLLERAGLPTDRRSKFHRVRRSTASHYEAAGGNATELLGHTSRKVTRLYLDPRIVRTPSAVDLLFRPGD